MFNLEEFLIKAQNLVLNYGLIGVFISTLIEEIISPIPSNLVIISLAVLFFLGKNFDLALSFNFLIFSLIASLGMLIGSLLIFFLAYFGGRAVIKKFNKFLGISLKDFERLEQFLHNHREDLVLLFLRIIPLVPSSVINVFFGLIGFHFVKFLLISLLGNFIRVLILTIITWRISQEFDFLFNLFKRSDVIGWMVFVFVILLIYFLLRRRKKAF